MVTNANKGYHFQNTYVSCVQCTHDMSIFIRVLHDNVYKLDKGYDEIVDNQTLYYSSKDTKHVILPTFAGRLF